MFLSNGMNKKIIGILVLIISMIGLILLLKTGVISKRIASQRSDNKILVSVSFYPLAFFAATIGGDKVTVVNITPAGAEPHDYEPTPQDIVNIEDSKILILNGGGLEAWGDDIRQNLKDKNILIVTVGENLTTRQLKENGKTIIDPHVWLSPTLAERMGDKITEAFMRVDPHNQTYYQMNRDMLKRRLQDLDRSYQQGLAECQSHDMVTSHAAFGYLAGAYNLNQIPIAGLSPDEEPSPRQLANIAQFAKKNAIHYIFFESLVSPKLSETIAREFGATTLVLDPIEGLSNDDMRQGKDYFTQMQTNLINLRIALQCR